MKPGNIGWVDLTVDDADSIRDFYSAVVGWDVDEVDMGDYADYAMKPPEGGPVAGVCHARGGNAGLPPVWMIYITVADLDESLSSCERLGGEIVGQPRSMGKDRYCIVKDPSGAACALYQPG